MPLLHKKPFIPNEFSIDLKENEEVFFCRITHEIFRDYDEFCERIILCNSLVWSCSLTGRSHLTYQEAAASEEKVKRLLKKFPMELRIPVLYLSSICERRSLIDLAEEVFLYVKDRFFIGETVQVNLPEGVRTCHVLSVIPPSTEELEASDHTPNGDRHWPPAFSFKYEVERHDTNDEIVVTADQIFRKKSSYNKDKNRLYIKQFVHLESGTWKLKENSYIKYGINKVRYDQIFCGEPPDMNPKKTTPVKKNGKKQETLNKYFKPTDKKYLAAKKNPSKKGEILAAKQKRKKNKKELDDARSSSGKSDQKQKTKSEKMEQRMKYAEFVKEWNMKREDLECEDLKDMPAAIPVECRLPNEYFGDVVMIMEFFHAFRKVLPVKDFFPNGIPFDLMERALIDKEIAGPFCDILQLLLTVIFELQEQESEETKDNDIKLTPGLIFERGDDETLRIMKCATEMDVWIKKHHGLPLSQLSLDTSTITEVLRLHLLCSGAKANKSKLSKWRYQSRGGYCSNDDPAVMLKRDNFHIIDNLSNRNVCDLSIKDKIDILNCLTNQILTYASLRDIIEEGCEKARQIRAELRSVRAAETKREKEEASRQRELKKDNAITENGVVLDSDPKNLRSGANEKKDELLCKEIRAALASAQLTPLGTDRAHRRFWVFSSMPGLFVEHYDDHHDRCLPKGTPVVNLNGSTTDGDNLAYIRRLFEESGNKENFAGTTQSVGSYVSPVKKLLVEKNGADSPVIGRNNNKSESSTQNLICWADPVNCPVHGTAVQKITWSFYHNAVQIDLLIDSLNRRGMRERKLRQALIQEKASILRHLQKCPVSKLNPNLTEAIGEEEKKIAKKILKQYDNANLNYPVGTSLDEIMEGSLRDLILETEEKITNGALGTVKVKDREAWRKAIRDNNYDKQCKKLTWGPKCDEEEDGLGIKEEEAVEIIKKEDESSRSSTPSIDGILTFKGFNCGPQRPVIYDLASAILQIEQGIDQKYLKRPLGLDPKERERGELKMPTPALERWETALMESTNIPQLFLHLSTLENSVTWEKSALNAFCKLCRRRTDPENMLLCDTCNKGHHLYCLKPKLTKVPSGDWHCPKCRPKHKVEPLRRKRRLFSEEESDTEDKEEWVCKTCSENGAQLLCYSCATFQHLTCVVPPMRKVPKSKWFCHECRQQNAAAMQKESQKDTSIVVENGSSPSTPPKEEDLSNADGGSPIINIERTSRTGRKQTTRIETPNDHVTQEDDDDYVGDDVVDDDDDYMMDVHDEDEDNDDGDDDIADDLIRWRVNTAVESERSSRRKSSKAATAKISQFAKQLRSNGWDDDDEDGIGDAENNYEGIASVRRSGRESASHRRNRNSGHHTSRDLPLDNAALLEILDDLMHHEDAWPFLRPVTKSEVPDYHQIIKKPMDLATIKHKLNMLSYTKNSELIADTELMFDNCHVYNEEGSEVYRAGVKLRKLFYKLCKKHNLQLDADTQDLPPAKKARTVL
uniref:Bromodomain adjacent to zinc finger domain protein 1A n=1 Tax=Panstrongylus megistus TaxID=65343 RepID=A0A069DXN6_9HEMI